MVTSSDSLILTLQKYSTCDVSDALSKLGHPHGGFVAGPTMLSPQSQAGESKIIGPAYTVKYVPVNDTSSPKYACHYIDSIPPGAVVFISSPRTVSAVYGGLMSNRAKASGAVGTVVDGRIRDLQDHRALGFPVFACDVGTLSPYGEVRVGGINVPVVMQNEGQDFVVKPGDYIIADLNGVVCLPADLAESAMALIPPQVEADERIAKDLQAGLPFMQASESHRKSLGKV